MLITIKIPDELYVRYSERNPSSPQKEIEKTLERFADIPHSDRLLVVPKEVRQELEKLTGAPIEKWDRFLSFFKDALSVRAGGVNVPLTEGQTKRLKAQAEFFKQDPQSFIETKVKSALFSYLGGA